MKDIAIDIPKPYMGRKVIIEKQFQVDGEWESMYAAHKWINDNGYDHGSSDRLNNPTAIVKGDYYKHPLQLPHKWHNFTGHQKKSVDGVIIGDLRNGPVIIKIFES